MNSKKTQTTIKSTLAALMLIIVMVVSALTGCSPATEPDPSQNSASTPVQVDSGEGGSEAGEGGESSEGGSEAGEGGSEGGNEAGEGGEGREGEHGSGAEGRREAGEGAEGAGSEEAGNALSLTESYDDVRQGARLIMNYDAASNSFVGTVENTTSSTLDQVRVEVHLSNGVELGPTTPVDLAAGEVTDVVLPATAEAFDGWTPHAEVGAGEHGPSGEGSESGGEAGEHGGEAGEHGGEAGEHGGEAGEQGHGGEGGESEGSESGGEAGEHGHGGEGGEGSGESGDPSSPILALDESWDGVVNGVRTAMSYDSTTGSFSGIVENTTDQTLCYVQIELNLKQGTTTVVELGPQPAGDLAPGAQTTVQLLVDDEPQAAGVAFDAWEIHPEVFDCNGPGPVNTEGADEGGHESGGEQHGAGGEGSGESGGEMSEGRSEHGTGGEGREGGEQHGAGGDDGSETGESGSEAGESSGEHGEGGNE